MSPARGPDQRERRSEDERELAELLSAWRAGKMVVRAILVAGLLLTTIAGAAAAIRGYFNVMPHP